MGQYSVLEADGGSGGEGCVDQNFRSNAIDWNNLNKAYAASDIVAAPSKLKNFREKTIDINAAIAAAGIEGVGPITVGPTYSGILKMDDRRERLDTFTNDVQNDILDLVDEPFEGKIKDLKVSVTNNSNITIPGEGTIGSLSIFDCDQEKIRAWLAQAIEPRCSALYEATAPQWIKDILGPDGYQYFVYTDDGFFLCTVPMEQLFEKAGLTDAMCQNVIGWYLFGVYDPDNIGSGVDYGAVITRHQGISVSKLPFTSIKMDVIEETIEVGKTHKDGEDFTQEETEYFFTSIAPVLLADDDKESYYKHPNNKILSYFSDVSKDGSIVIANLIVQDNYRTLSTPKVYSDSYTGPRTVEFPHNYNVYCSQTRAAIDSLVAQGICEKDETGKITMTVSLDNLSRDQYNALLMMTTDDPDIYAYIAENYGHAKNCRWYLPFWRRQAVVADCWPGENEKADNGGSRNNPFGGNEGHYKDKDGMYYEDAVEGHKELSSN